MSEAFERLLRFAGREPGASPVTSPAPAEPTPEPIEQSTDPRQRVKAMMWNGEDLLRSFIELARRDPIYLERLAHAFEWKAPFAKAKAIEPCPMLKATSFEISLSDNGPPRTSKAKDQRERLEREPLRFTGTVQVYTKGNKQRSAPDWTGRIEFRNGKRAKVNARRFQKEGTFSATFLGIVEQVVDNCDDGDTLFGFMRADTDQQGSPSVDGFVYVASKQALIERTATVLCYALDGKGVVRTALPPFDTKTNKGNRLAGGFVMQCRASHADTDWSTGSFKFERFS